MIPLKSEIYHVCELDVVPDRIVSKLHPNASRFHKFLDKCRHWTILSPSNHRCQEFFRSRHAILKERQRHLLTPRYRYIIHPFSKFSKLREISMTIIWTVLMFIEPFTGTFEFFENNIHSRYEIDSPTEYATEVFSWLAGLNIITCFFMGYAINQTREVILEPRKIVKRYVLSYFFFDLLLLCKSVLQISPRIQHISLQTEIFFAQLYVFRLARMNTRSDYFVFCLKLLKFKDSSIQCIRIVLSTWFILHWCTCIMCLIPLIFEVQGWDISDSWTIEAKVTSRDDRTIFERYIRFLMVVMCHFYGASRTSFWTNNAAEMTALSLVTVCGVGYYTFAIAVVGQLFRTANISETKYDELVTQVKDYALNKKLPDHLKKRLLRYYESKFQRKFFEENAILQSLSEHLRLEVMLYSCKHLIESVHVFQGLSKSAIGTMLALLKQEVFLTGDKITSSSEVNNELYYFVSYGTVACIVIQSDARTGKEHKIELMHLEDGDHFGESSLQIKHDHDNTEVFYTVAIEGTEIFSMPIKKLARCKEMFPEISVKIERMHQKRKDYIANYLRLSREKTDDDILKELAYGRILSHGRKRPF